MASILDLLNNLLSPVVYPERQQEQDLFGPLWGGRMPSSTHEMFARQAAGEMGGVMPRGVREPSPRAQASVPGPPPPPQSPQLPNPDAMTLLAKVGNPANVPDLPMPRAESRQALADRNIAAMQGRMPYSPVGQNGVTLEDFLQPQLERGRAQRRSHGREEYGMLSPLGNYPTSMPQREAPPDVTRIEGVKLNPTGRKPSKTKEQSIKDAIARRAAMRASKRGQMVADESLPEKFRNRLNENAVSRMEAKQGGSISGPVVLENGQINNDEVARQARKLSQQTGAPMAWSMMQILGNARGLQKTQAEMRLNQQQIDMQDPIKQFERLKTAEPGSAIAAGLPPEIQSHIELEVGRINQWSDPVLKQELQASRGLFTPADQERQEFVQRVKSKYPAFDETELARYFDMQVNGTTSQPGAAGTKPTPAMLNMLGGPAVSSSPARTFWIGGLYDALFN